MKSDNRKEEGAVLEEKYLVLSDLHGNISAFDAVMSDCENEVFTGVILLGDLIDYGMRSNEIIQRINTFETHEWNNKILVNIWGNHEKLYVDKDLERLSSDRGRVMARYTAEHLNEISALYIKEHMEKAGIMDFSIGGLRCLAVHGSIEDHFWKPIEPLNLIGEYVTYDIVMSGHSHYSHCFTHFYPVEDEGLRNRKAVTFINPGSVGQPRNQNPFAQYAVLSLPSKRTELRAVKYDIEYEQSLFPDEIDAFYRIRLTRGV